MPRSRSLDAMRLLRRMELDQARNRLGQALQAERQAAVGETQALAILAAEVAGGPAGDYAAWLPAGLSRLAQASQTRLSAHAALAPALEAVARAEIGKRMVAAEAARCASLRRTARLARDQAWLEDLGPGAVSLPDP
jgi:hypothetical protein